MIVSSLAYKTIMSPNKNKRNHAVDTITIHAMAGNMTAESCGNWFAKSSTKASSNYGVDSNGKIACYVPEEYRSWATSNAANDHRAITIEVANDGGANTGWHVSNTALAALIKLIVDICKRNGIKKLVWSTKKDDRVNHRNGCNMTVHRDYANKACPGDYLMSKHPYIVDQVNAKLNGGVTPTPQPQPQPTPTPAPASGYVYNGTDLSLVFDPKFYADTNPDVKQAFGYNSTQLFNHFTTNGMKEARQAIYNFNPKVYRQKYADLDKAFGNNWIMYYLHYCTAGIKEGRIGI